MPCHFERLTPGEVPWYSPRLLEEHRVRYRFAARFVRGKVAADIACGVGYGSVILAESGAEKVLAIDSSSEALDYAREHYSRPKISYLRADACRTGLKDDSVDVLISLEIIEHLKNPEKFLGEARRILKDQGLFIVSTPNRRFSFWDNPFHFQEFTSDELIKLLRLYFKSITFYGQRPVNLRWENFKQELVRRLPFNWLRWLLKFRPLSGTKIHRLEPTADTFYLYFIAVCK